MVPTGPVENPEEAPKEKEESDGGPQDALPDCTWGRGETGPECPEVVPDEPTTGPADPKAYCTAPAPEAEIDERSHREGSIGEEGVSIEVERTISHGQSADQ